MQRGIIACVAVGSDVYIDAHAAQHGGKKHRCGDCGVPVWMAPASQKFLRDVPQPVVCQKCAAKLMEAGPFILALPPCTEADLAAILQGEQDQVKSN
jgi:hypothetical protein